VILEALTGPDKPQDDLHHRSYFLSELRRIEAGEFVLTMTRDKSCPINPLATHTVYAEVKMESIAEMIPLISPEPLASWRMFSSEQTAPSKRFEFIRSSLNNFATCFPGLMRKY
jgi:hypothetical protein